VTCSFIITTKKIIGELDESVFAKVLHVLEATVVPWKFLGAK
jgi:hypothetical protein